MSRDLPITLDLVALLIYKVSYLDFVFGRGVKGELSNLQYSTKQE